MCIIIDANVAYKMIAQNDEDAEMVRSWLLAGKGRIAIGGRNKQELEACSFRSLLKQYILAGRVSEYRTAEVAAAEAGLKEVALKSDDPHIIALARVSGSRVVFSEDQALHKDFKSKDILNDPRGKVYQRKSHKGVLSSAPNCRGT